MMTLDEMKLAVCEKLPEFIWILLPTNKIFWRIKMSETRSLAEIYWPTEGLQVCHEAEKLLTAKEKSTYMCWFWEHDEIFKNRFAQLTATYEQRLEALCRVWFPERFL